MDVGERADGFDVAVGLLGCHVRGRSLHRALDTHPRFVGQDREPEIGDEHFPVRIVDQDVGRLQVAVGNVQRVCSRDAERELAHDRGGIARHERRLPSVQHLGQRVGHQVHHDERPAGIGADRIDRADVLVVNVRRGPRLAEERIDLIGSHVRVLGNLDRDFPLKLRIEPAVNDSEGTPSQNASDLERADAVRQFDRRFRGRLAAVTLDEQARAGLVTVRGLGERHGVGSRWSDLRADVIRVAFGHGIGPTRRIG